MPLRIIGLVKNKIDSFIKKAAAAHGEEEIASLIVMASTLLDENPNNIQLLLARADLYTRQQNLGQAINDYRSILARDSDNTSAKVQIEQLLMILKYQNTDIFESPNTNFDPWLD